MSAANGNSLDSLVGRGFKTIVADPPWRTTTGPQWKFKDNGHKPLAYPVMSMDEIKALPVGDVADDAAHLFLWTTNILVRKAYDVVEAWGFKPSVLLTWAKNPLGMGLGDAFGITTEHVLFAHRGGLRPLRRVPTTWWNWTRGRHSEKPEAFQDMVETVSPGPYLELFARRQRLNWTVWGNEVEANKLDERTPPESELEKLMRERIAERGIVKINMVEAAHRRLS